MGEHESTQAVGNGMAVPWVRSSLLPRYAGLDGVAPPILLVGGTPTYASHGN